MFGVLTKKPWVKQDSYEAEVLARYALVEKERTGNMEVDILGVSGLANLATDRSLKESG